MAGNLLDQWCKYFAGLAYLHFFLPVFLNLSVTNRAVNEPAQLTGAELPGRAFDFKFRAAFFNLPAGFRLALFGILLDR